MDRTILGWIFIGLVVGLAAAPLMRHRNPGGAVVTMLVAMVGALFTSFSVQAAGIRFASPWHQHGVAAAGSVALLIGYWLVLLRRTI